VVATAALLLLVLLLPAAQTSGAVVFTTDTTVAGTDLTYDGQDITVQGCVLTVSGQHQFASLAVVSNGTVTHPAFTDTEVHSLDLVISGALTIEAGSAVDVSGRGYIGDRTVGNTTEGASTGHSGGSYGGLGYPAPAGSGVPNRTYGDFRDPQHPGAGGGGAEPGYGTGGGLVRLVAGSLVLDGAIRADGRGALGGDRPGGAGGGIRLDVGTLSGAGSISANGGNATWDSGSGGGGRIAIYYDTVTTFDLLANVTAHGGLNGGAHGGGVGTVYLHPNGGAETLRLVSHGVPNHSWTPLGLPGDSTFAVANLVLSGAGVVAATEHQMPIQAERLDILSGAMLTHQPTTLDTEYWLDLQVEGTLTLDAASTIDVSERGYLCTRTVGNVPVAAGVGRSGGSYGGLGFVPADSGPMWTYGDFRDPQYPGSGASVLGFGGVGGVGGGLVRITAAGAVIDGSILANGGAASGGNVPGGAGGGVLLRVGALSSAGSGRISANGGDATWDSGSGGGGRIAVYYDTVTGFDLLEKVTAHGGRNETLHGGAVGTVYLHPNGGAAVLRLVSHGAVTSSWTPLGLAGDTEFAVATLVMSGAGVVAAPEHEMPIQVDQFDILGGAMLTHRETTADQVYTLAVSVTGALSLDAASTIQVSERGYLCTRTVGNTPVAAGVGRSGGSYGGLGFVPENSSPMWTYGDFRDPQYPGSGASVLGFGGVGGVGGGLVRITAAAATLDGSILANGGGAHGGNVPGGAGGGVLLRVGALSSSGSGRISANGGNATWDSGSGGGGRIAVHYDTVAGFDLLGRVSAHGGANESAHGGAVGTVYLQQGTGAGVLRLVSHGVVTGSWTPLGQAGDTEVQVGHLLLDGAGVMAAAEHDMPISADRVDLLGGALLTHQAATAAQEYALRLSVAGALTIDSTSRIDVSGRGYLPGRALGNTTVGAATGRAGGSYGGLGGYEVGPAGVPNAVYGDFRNPSGPGSGGGAQYAGAGAGGGLVRIAADTLTLDGSLLANGVAGTSDRPGGSGGGIDVRVTTLSGSGTCAANGGDSSSNSGAGGGGRIAVHYADATAFTGFAAATAAAGTGGQPAENGTVFFDNTTAAHDEVVVYHSLALPEGANDTFASITVRDGAALTLGGGSVITVLGALRLEGNAALICRGRNAAGQVGGEWAGQGVEIRAGEVSVAAGALISADGQGYTSVPAAPGNGPGGGWGAWGTIGHGAGHGGAGGGQAVGYGLTYGSAEEPVDLGSAGGGLQDGGLGGAGGGAVRLVVTGTLTLDGRVSANATAPSGSWYPGGGAGGSIWVTTGTLTGGGVLQANGTAGGLHTTGGGGGGGRIAVYYGEDGGFIGFATASAAPGSGGAGNQQPGTIAFFRTEGSANHLFVYQGYVIPEESSPSYAALTVGNGGTLSIGGGSTITVEGLLHVTGNSTVLCQSQHGTGRVDGQWAGRGVEICAGDITIDSGSTLSADEQGYAPAPAAPGNGPGAGWGTNGTIARGAGHGGHGGCEVAGYGETYGSAVFPLDPGSAGGGCADGGLGGPGGGAILLQVADTLTVDGTLSANAGPVSVAWYPGGGAGGSICVNAKAVVGTGTVSANGSAGGVYFHVKHAGKGGGGRVALHWWDRMTLPESQITVDPGDDGNPSWPAEAGSRVLSNTPQFLVLQPDRSQAHDVEGVRWVALATEVSALSVDLAAYRSGGGIALDLGTGLPALGQRTWDTTTAADGQYEVRATFRDGTGAVVGEGRRLVILNNSVAWHAGRIEADQTWAADRVHVVEANVSLAPGVRLIVEPGAVVKFASRLMLTAEPGAILDALARADAPIVFTSLADDAAGGDTNADGDQTLPHPGDWLGVAVQAGGQFLTNAFVAIRYTATTHSGALTTDEAWPGDAVHHLTGDVIVPNNLTLTINAGAVVKLATGTSLIVQTGGRLVVAGSAAQPAVITSERDDSAGGDTNGDGSATQPAPGDWYRIHVDGGRADFDHAQIRYGSGTDGVSAGLVRTSGAAQVSIANSMLTDGQFTGILAWGGPVTVTNTLIVGVDRGVSAHPGSSVAVTHCTLVGNRIGLLAHGGALTAANSIISHSIVSGLQYDFGTIAGVSYCDVWAPPDDDYANYRDTADLTGTAGNIAANPIYKDLSRRNLRLDYRSPCIDAADGTAAPATDLAGAPRYNDPRTPDTGVPMPGRDEAPAIPDMGAFEFVETAASGIDLVVTGVTGPLEATAGGTVTLHWTVTNLGTAAANGPWHDTVYLVRDPETSPVPLPAGEVLAGQGVHLGPGQSVEVSGQVRVPGSTATPHRWQVVTNTRGEVFEGQNTGNNTAQAAALVTVAVPALAVGGGPGSDQFTAVGQSQWYAFTPAAGQDVLLSLDLAGSGATEIHVGFGRMPTRQAYDVASAAWNSPDVSALVSAADGQTCYVLVYAAALDSTPMAFSLRAEVLDFSLTAVSPAQCGRGPVTLRVSGGQLREDMTYRLRRPGNTTHAATGAFLANPALAFVTFDLAAAAMGTYTLEADRDGAVRTLAGAVTVTDAAPGWTEYSVEAPAATRPGWVESLTIHYRNAGSTDVVAPLLHLVVVGADPPDYSSFVQPMSYVSPMNPMKDEDTPVYMWRYLLGISPEGPAGVLPPGVGGEFTVEIDPAINTGAVEYQLRAVTDPSLPVDWAGIGVAGKPDFVDDEAWAAAFASYQALMGPTVGEFQQAIARQATYLSRMGERVSEVSDLSYLALAESGLSQILPRYALGAMGRGRTHPYDLWGEVKGDQVLLHYPGPRVRQFTSAAAAAAGADETRYEGVPGDRGVLVASAATGTWALTEPEGGTMAFVADGSASTRHRLAYCEDRNGNRTTLEYTAGRVTRVVFADGLASTYQYNAAGRLVSATDPFGVPTTFTYDASDEHLTSITSQGLTTTYTYITGQGPATEHALASVALADGRVVRFEYDSLGRRVRASEAVSGWEQTLAYGPGPRQVVTGPEGSGVDLRYNRFGQLGQAIGPLGAGPSFAYDEAHQLTGLSGPGGVRCSMAYDAAGQRTALVHGSGGQVSASYGAFGLLQRLVDPLGRVTAFQRDARGNLLATTYPDGSRALQTVDARGELSVTTNRRGQTTRYERDGQRRLSRIEYPDATTLDYTYDSRYRQTAVTGPAGSTALAYDEANRVTEVTYPGGRSLQYTYDSLGRRTGMRDQGGFQIAYAYDAVGRLSVLSTGAGQALVSYAYDVSGRLVREDRANGTYSTYAYDAAGRLTHLVHRAADGAELARFAYGYDAAGRRASVETAEGTWQYAYDGRSQLTQAVLPNGRTIQYTYDLAGNRTTVCDDGAATAYAVNTLDQYVTLGGTTRQHDADGNLTGSTAAGGRTYAYDSQGRLTAASAGASAWSWEYDAFGNRAAMTESGQRSEYLVDPTGIGALVAEYDADGGLAAHYVHGLGPVCRIDASGEIAFYGFDGNANAALLTGPDGSVLNRYVYLPFGEPLVCDEAVPNPFRFAGRQGVLTDGSGLVHMRQRWYEPETGRFLQPDPIGPFGGNANLYAYAGNAPTLFTDPLGLYQSMQDMLLGEFGMGFLNSALNADYGLFSPSPDYDRINAEITSHTQNHYYLQNAQHVVALLQSGTFTQQELHSPAVQAGLVQHVLTGVNVNAAIWHFQSNFQGAQALAPYTYVNVTGNSIYCGTITPPTDSAAGAAYAQNQDVFNQFVLNHCHNPTPDRPVAPCLTLPLDGPHGGRSPLDCPSCPKAERSPPFPGGITTGDVCVLQPVVTSQIPVHTAYDPNDIHGPAGVGGAAWIAVEPMGYTIRFENQASATAPAQRVVVTLTLDAATDWSTFKLGSAGFGNVHIPVPAGLQSYSARADLRESRGLYVDFAAGLAPATGLVTWTFTSIDPVTGLPTRDPLAGFLPPNVAAPEGEGYVRYTVQPQAGAGTGTVIQAQAGIVFDTNDPILTNTAENTLDVDAPATASLSALRRGDGSLLELTLAGDDGAGSGVVSFDLYAGLDGGPLVLQSTVEVSSATLDGDWGHQYELAAVARDAVGHVMPLGRAAETSLRVPQWALRLNAAGAAPAALYLGADTLATAGFDAAFDEDAPTDGRAAGEVALVGTDDGHESLLYDVQPQGPTVTWLVDVQPGDSPVTLSWDPVRTPAGRWLWLAQVDGAGTPQGQTFVDMVTRSQAEVPEAGAWQVTLGDERTEAIRLEPEWNLVALGVTPPDAGPAAVFGAQWVPGLCWGVAGGDRSAPLLQPASAVEPLAGYWVYGLDTSAPLVSGPAATTALALHAGWNLVGVGWDTILPADPAVAGLAWGWDPGSQGYVGVVPGDRLQAGRAYWVFCAAPTTLDLPPTPLP